MTFLAPIFLAAALAAAGVVVALHFLVTSPPPLVPLPTTRFIPQSSVIVASFARRPEHLLLLLLRVLALLLIGAAFSRPVLLPRRRALARVIVADRSSAVASIAEVRDSLRRLGRPGDRVLAFDSTVRALPSGGADSLVAGQGTGSLSAALVAARQAGSEVSLEADSVELLLVSPFATEEWDAATAPIRALWPGRIRLVRVLSRPDAAGSPGVWFKGASDDPLAITANLVRPGSREANVQILRGDPAPEDNRWMEAGGTRVDWPVNGPPPGWVPLERPDTVGAVVAAGEAVVFPFERRWRPDSASLAGARVVARWVDGTPAALEQARGRGCTRTVTIAVSARGDFTIRPDFVRLFRALSNPCGAADAVLPLGANDLTILAGSGPLASRAEIHPPEAPDAPLVPWLLAAAFLLALLELWVRRRKAPAKDPPESFAPPGAAA